MLKILLIAFLLLVLAFAGLGIRLLLDRMNVFPKSCQAKGNGEEKSYSCGCGVGYCKAEEVKSLEKPDQSG